MTHEDDTYILDRTANRIPLAQNFALPKGWLQSLGCRGTPYLGTAYCSHEENRSSRQVRTPSGRAIRRGDQKRIVSILSQQIVALQVSIYNAMIIQCLYCVGYLIGPEVLCLVLRPIQKRADDHRLCKSISLFYEKAHGS